GVCCRYRAEGRSGFGMRVFPAFTTTASRLCPETDAPRPPFGETHFNSPTAPSADDCGHHRIAPTIFQGHLSLQGTPFRSSHFGGCQAPISHLRWPKRLIRFECRVLPAHNMAFRQSENVL